MKPYKTTQGESSASYEIQRSKFYTHTKHVESEEEARAFIQEQKKAYFDARHNCSAYVLGPDGAKQKSNDDGEPCGTAGNPILDAIKKNDLTDIVVVVTRYFGGIKLGAGGLIRAYSHSAVLGLEAADVVEMLPLAVVRVTISYDLLASVENFLRKKELRTGEKSYAEEVMVEVLLREEEKDDVLAALTDLTSGRARYEDAGTQVMAVPVPRASS
ncbi:MAG: YigZ family protein [Selenomonas sp.]|uniref:YigZ family protein n=1 Tax=Selenomonas sp. TaxID=2053611 RepID=UPI0025FCFC2E|nr:YigZ family protein [Selenomonas sp.]MCI6231316.1 YigZ family protein [Selenomonas sp.]